MSESLSTSRNHEWKRRAVLALVGVLAYLVLPAALGHSTRPPGHFVALAQSFLHGTTKITAKKDSGLRTDELIPAHRPEIIEYETLPDGTQKEVEKNDWEFYCPYPPLPAVLLMPFVWLFGSAVRVELVCRVVSILNILIFDASLRRLSVRLYMPPLSGFARTAMTALFAFGTAMWHNAFMGSDWQLAHAVALMFMLLALREYSNKYRLGQIGLFVSCALAARPTAAIGLLFFLLAVRRNSPDREAENPRKLYMHSLFSSFFFMALILFSTANLLAIYNRSRFYRGLDFGYTRMLLSGEGQRLMAEYGQFNIAFIPRNFFWFFLAPLWLRADGRFPWLGYDPHGLSLFIASPALIYAIVVIYHSFKKSSGGPMEQMPSSASLGGDTAFEGDRQRRWIVWSAAITMICTLVPLLMYFNTGFWQFGHRFSLDYLVPLMVLVLAGITTRPSKWAYALIGLSILMQTWGICFDSVARIPV